MTRWDGRVLFIDAFAGPGEYSRGEPGSPVIALKALVDHSAKSRIGSEIEYLFIEKDFERYTHLSEVLLDMDAALPSNCKYSVINSTFDATLTNALDRIDEQRSKLAPAFVMIDPFGVSDTPMSTVARILRNPKSEVYISFMYREINRFKNHPNFEHHLDELFGCSQWRKAIDWDDGKHRKRFFYDLYISQLKKYGARYVVHFDLYEGESLVYAIFFGTKSLEGCDKMKQAIWKVAPFGDFRFRGGRLGQLTLGEDMIDFGLLENTLKEQFAPTGWLRIETIEAFVKSDRTDFHSSHLKTKTLKPMEAAGRIEVKEGTRKRPGTYPKGTVLRFLG